MIRTLFSIFILLLSSCARSAEDKKKAQKKVSSIATARTNTELEAFIHRNEPYVADVAKAKVNKYNYILSRIDGMTSSELKFINSMMNYPNFPNNYSIGSENIESAQSNTTSAIIDCGCA